MTPNDPKGEAGSKKAPMWLLPPAALEQVAWVHRLGSEKYGPYNWRKTGVCATTYVSAIMRHLGAWRDGEDLDPESGLSHIAHIATSCNILIDAAHCGTLQDDRNKVPYVFQPSDFSPETDAFEEHPTTTSPMPDGIEWLGGVYIGGKHRPYPPVPVGYDRWEPRGWGWRSDTQVAYAFCCRENPVWASTEGRLYFPMGSSGCFYIEAVKDDPREAIDDAWLCAPAPAARFDWVQIGDYVEVAPVKAYKFDATIENILDVRGKKVYVFDIGPTLDEDEIFSITKLS